MVIVLFVVVSALIGMMASWIGQMSYIAQARRKQAYVEAAAQQLGLWYARNPVDVDGASQPVVPGCAGALATCLLTAAGVVPRYNVTVSIGARQTASTGFPYRTMTVWIPNPTATGAQRTTYQAAYSLASSAVDGYSIERQLQQQSVEAVANVADAMQDGYSAWLSSDHDTGLDWFQPTNCGSADKGSNPVVACAGSWTPVANSSIGQASAWRGATTDAWGDPIEICNTSACGAQDDSEPYDMAVRAVTPWGYTILRMAVEPLEAAG